MKRRSIRSPLPALAAALVCLAAAARAAEEARDDAKKPLEIEATAAEATWLARAQAGDWITSRSTVRLDGETNVVTDARRSVWRVRDGEANDQGNTRVVEVKEEAALGGNTSATEVHYRVKPASSDSADGSGNAPLGQAKGADKRKIAGKTVNCRVYERTVEAGKRKVKIRTWRSDDLPLDGVARIEHDGKAVYEVLDFGRGK
ncbi:MAG: hypothetical protein L6R28_15925 [Planctomycetes bacterium]|nr:hypothetical protein [Planctomycetota bacterium]